MTGRPRVGGLFVIAMLAFSAAGCNDREGDTLTPEEAAALAELIGRASLGAVEGQLRGWGFGFGAPPPPGPAADLWGSTEYDFDKDCSEGGSVYLSGTEYYEFGEDGLSLELDGPVAFDHCAEETDDGVTYALTGSVFHLLQAAVGFWDGAVRVEVHGTATGSVDWEDGDGGSGVWCEVDVAIDVTVIDKEAGRVTGTVCGISVEVDAGDWLDKRWP